jgi:hypothetical protein
MLGRRGHRAADGYPPRGAGTGLGCGNGVAGVRPKFARYREVPTAKWSELRYGLEASWRTNYGEAAQA